MDAVRNLVELAIRQPNAGISAILSLTAGFIRNPDTKDFLRDTYALHYPQQIVSALYLLQLALLYTPEADLIADILLMDALKDKVTAAASMIHDLNHQSFSIPVEIVQALDCLLSQLEQLQGLPYRETQVARSQLSRQLRYDQSSWTQFWRPFSWG